MATFGLLLTIFGCLATGQKRDIPMAVGLYVVAGYWYTSSTAFANPAVTIGRAFTSTFASIAPGSIGHYLGGQLLGTTVALPFIGWLYDRHGVADAMMVLARRSPRPTTAGQTTDEVAVCAPLAEPGAVGTPAPAVTVILVPSTPNGGSW